MSFLRSLAFLVFQLIFTPLYAIAVLLLFWMPPVAAIPLHYGLVLGQPLRGAVLCGIKWHVQGQENIPRDQPHIVMSKHSSTWETLSLNFYFPPLAFVAKKELLSIPFFGWAFASGVTHHDRPEVRH